MWPLPACPHLLWESCEPPLPTTAKKRLCAGSGMPTCQGHMSAGSLDHLRCVGRAADSMFLH